MSERPFPWRTLLFISIALNLLVIGAVAGALGSGARLERRDPEVMVAAIPGVSGFISALPPEAQQPFRQELARSWVETRDLRRAALQARREAVETAAIEPYDAARTRAAFQRMRESELAVVLVFQNNLLDEFGALSPEQRAQALAALRAAAPVRSGAAIGENGRLTPPAALSPEQREERREQLRERFRERMRERREERRQQPEP